MSECVVYHKHIAGMDLTEGYIGISKHFEQRMQQHDREAFVRGSMYVVHDMMRKHKEEVITTIIKTGSIKDCLAYENELRPEWRIGWNMAIGGGRPGSGWSASLGWLSEYLYNPSTKKTKRIEKNYKLIDFVKEYNLGNGTTSAVGNLSRLMYGRTPTAYGWELEDGQLSNRIKERFYKPWEHIYLRKEDSVVLVHKSGNSKFHQSIGRTSQRGVTTNVHNGTVQNKDGWELATEEEWLETAERVEFK